MSDHEKKSGSSGTGSLPVVVVGQTSGNRQKHPYRSNELQEETAELHHKRSRAPGVPSVVEELKDGSEESNVSSNLDNDDHALSYDKQKQSLAKKLSSSTKKYDTLEHADYETITLAPMQIEIKLNSTVKPTQAASSSELVKESAAPHAVEKSAEQKAEEDSITDEVAELRTPETAKKQLEWAKNTVSFDLEKKASIGPCQRPGTPFERPSGITLCLPKKSLAAVNVPQYGINFTIHKRPSSKSAINFEMQEHSGGKHDDSQNT